jgi:hypothetical protein
MLKHQMKLWCPEGPCRTASSVDARQGRRKEQRPTWGSLRPCAPPSAESLPEQRVDRLASSRVLLSLGLRIDANGGVVARDTALRARARVGVGRA